MRISDRWRQGRKILNLSRGRSGSVVENTSSIRDPLKKDWDTQRDHRKEKPLGKTMEFRKTEGTIGIHEDVLVEKPSAVHLCRKQSFHFQPPKQVSPSRKGVNCSLQWFSSLERHYSFQMQ